MIKVAGVTFDNDPIDGGRNRQDILKELFDASDDEVVEILVDALYIRRRDATFGIKLVEHNTKQVIGWMHSKTADNIVLSGKKPKQYKGFISYHGSYHVKLDNL